MELVYDDEALADLEDIFSRIAGAQDRDGAWVMESVAYRHVLPIQII
jgi:hypothetical protein